jgi:hypothetical protein
MKEAVILDKLKEATGNDRIVAAVFYTFNFDPVFFEQHILTAFLPDVPFSDNEIQNNILWRQFAVDLPPVTVYCDFHAKDSTRGPSLPYSIRAIDMKTGKHGKPCFHPKVSFILLKNSLVLITGSNNLTPGGWSHNKEVFSVLRLNGSDYPYSLKDDLRTFLYNTSALHSGGLSTAEEKVKSFFNKRGHTNDNGVSFFNNHKKSFNTLLEELIRKNGGPFERIEILSPYLSENETFAENLKKYVSGGDIHLAIPYMGINEVSVTEACYNMYRDKGMIWCDLIHQTKDGFSRFNHSKIYRLKGNNVCFTVFGSVNLTEMAWNSVKNGGNVETAMIVEHKPQDFGNILQETSENKLTFLQEQKDETKRNIRHNVPNLRFTIHWGMKDLTYVAEDEGFDGVLYLSNTEQVHIGTGSGNIPLDREALEFLSDNPLIRVIAGSEEFFFYPDQKGIESKPLSSKYRLTDKEVLELWEKISDKEHGFTELTQLREKYILTRLDREGNWKEDDDSRVKSTMNLMAAHISALIRLEEKLFSIPRKKGDHQKKVKQISYYLFAENVDTIPSYISLLDTMHKNKELNPGVYWFL